MHTFDREKVKTGVISTAVGGACTALGAACVLGGNPMGLIAADYFVFTSAAFAIGCYYTSCGAAILTHTGCQSRQMSRTATPLRDAGQNSGTVFLLPQQLAM